MSKPTTTQLVQQPVPTGEAHIVDTRSFVFWVVIAVGIYAGVHQFHDLTSNVFVTSAPSHAWLALVEWAIYGGIFFAIVYTHQLFVRRSPWVTVAALLWGGVIATWFAIQANLALGQLFDLWFSDSFNDSWATPISAATNEEVLKTLGVVVLALLPLTRVRSTLDGWFYGMMVGLGFQLVEDYIYTSEQSNNLGEVVDFLLTRGLISGLWAHAVYTGIIGAGIGYFMSHKDQPLVKRLGIVVGLFCLVWFFHVMWDTEAINELFGDSTLAFVGVVLLKGLPALTVLLLMVRWGRTEERATWSAFVQDHIDPALVPEADATALLHRRTRREARKDAARQAGHAAGRMQKHLQLAQLRYVQSVMEAGADSAAATHEAEAIRELKQHQSVTLDEPATV